MIRVTRNLVDPASSHMLVSRIKPCKSQSKWINSGSADGSLNQQQSTRGRRLTALSWITMVTPLLIHVRKIRLTSNSVGETLPG